MSISRAFLREHFLWIHHNVNPKVWAFFYMMLNKLHWSSMIKLYICFKDGLNLYRKGNRIHCLLLIKSSIFLLQCKFPYFTLTLEFYIVPCMIIMERSGLEFQRGRAQRQLQKGRDTLQDVLPCTTPCNSQKLWVLRSWLNFAKTLNFYCSDSTLYLLPKHCPLQLLQSEAPLCCQPLSWLRLHWEQ